MTQKNNSNMNRMISLFLLLWFLLLKSGNTEENSFDEELCSIRFYSIQHFKGNSWTKTSGGGWKYSTDTLSSHPIGKFLPKSIRTYGNASKCKEIWRICPFGAVMNKKRTKCRKLRHGEALASVSRWGWNNSFLGHVRSLRKTDRTTTSVRTPYPSLPLKVPKEIFVNRNVKNTDTTNINPQISTEKPNLKEQNRSSSPIGGLPTESQGTNAIYLYKSLQYSYTCYFCIYICLCTNL